MRDRHEFVPAEPLYLPLDPTYCLPAGECFERICTSPSARLNYRFERAAEFCIARSPASMCGCSSLGASAKCGRVASIVSSETDSGILAHLHYCFHEKLNWWSITFVTGRETGFSFSLCPKCSLYQKKRAISLARRQRRSRAEGPVILGSLPWNSMKAGAPKRIRTSTKGFEDPYAVHYTIGALG